MEMRLNREEGLKKQQRPAEGRPLDLDLTARRW